MDLFARDVTFPALAKALGLQSKRQTLIAENIANVNTPRLQAPRYERTSARSWRTALGGRRRSTPEQRVARVMQAVAREVVAEELFYRADMGGVDLDREMAELAKTSLLYAAYGSTAAEAHRPVPDGDPRRPDVAAGRWRAERRAAALLVERRTAWRRRSGRICFAG